MVSSADLLFGAGVLASVALCALGVYSYRRWNEPGVTALTVFLVLLGLSGVGGGVASLVFGPEWNGGPRWLSIALVGAMLWCLPWGIFGLQYTGRYTRISGRRLWLLVAPYGLLSVFAVAEFVLGGSPDVFVSLLAVTLLLYLFGLLSFSRRVSSTHTFRSGRV